MVHSRVSLLRRAFCRGADKAECSACGLRVISSSFHTTVAALFLKGIVGYLSGSQSLLADALHSAADSAGFGLNRFSAQRTGTGRFWVGLIIGVLTFLSGVWVFTDSLTIIMIGEHNHPGLVGVVVAAGSVLTNLYLYRVSACASRTSESQAIRFCLIQNRTNFYAACFALTGTVLADLGLVVCDPVFAILIGFFLFTGALQILNEALAEAPPEWGSARSVLFLLLVLLSAGLVGSVAYRLSSRDDVILIPAEGATQGSQVDTLLGRAHYFLICDTRHHTIKPVYNGARFVPTDVSDQLVSLMKTEDVDVVLARQVGPEMLNDLSAAGARVYYVDRPLTVGEALKSYQGGRFSRATAANVERAFGRGRMRWLSPW